jgi:hypothetical protein
MKLLQREAGVAAKPRFGDSLGRVAASTPLPPARTRRFAPRPSFAAVVLLVLAWFAVLAVVRPLMLPDEGRYAGIAWEMLRSGEWLTPTLDGLPFFHKPPLFYWITAAAMAIFGPGEFAARAAPLLGAWLAALASYVFVRRWWSERAARLVLVGMLLHPLFALGGQYANLDMLVAGLITATVLLLAHAALSFDRGLLYRAAVAGAYGTAALGMLAKGLIGFVIPALVIGAWLVLQRRWRTLLALVSLPGVLLFASIAAPWFFAMQSRFPDFFDYFFFVQHFRRFAAGGFNNAQPFWFFPAVLLVLCVPWAPWLRHQFARARFAPPLLGETRLLLVLWAGLVTVFFSLPESKLVGYILPALPPIAMLAADGFAHPSRPVAPWGWNAAAIGGLVLSTALALVFTFHPVESWREFAAAIRSQSSGDEPVFMVGNYYFDVPVYGRLAHPVRIVDDWADPEIERRDNWRKELVEAGRFAPVRAEHVLVKPEHFAAALCEAPVSWVIGESALNGRFAFLAASLPVSAVRGTSLWRVDTSSPRVAKALGCPVQHVP